MKGELLLAEVSRRFLKERRVYRWGMKKVSELSDEACIRYCHWYCEKTGQTGRFEAFRAKIESEYRYCGYLDEYIEDGLCCDIQMICAGYIKPSALAEYVIDDNTAAACAACRYQWSG